tara:strand:- start:833 stop:1552 length:720 start_codon:yes stop_codon:yes gene_type:complete
MNNSFYHLLLIACYAFVNFATIDKVHAQNLERFQNEVDAIVERYAQYGKKSGDIHTNATSSDQTLAVFTGSSSVRLWTSLSNDFPELTILNTGFGGSTFAELFHYRHQLIGQYTPDMVIIYEGDNDVTGSNTVDEIFDKAQELYSYLAQELPETKVYILAAKPSPLRWNLKPLYDALNIHFADFAVENDQSIYIDIWNPMLGENGKPMPSIFLSDSLHMNKAGYLIWKQTIAPFLQVSK